MSMKYLMSLMMAALMVATANAQEKSGGTNELKSRSEMMAERMVNELGLNADQATKVQAITKKYDEKATGRPSAIATEDIAPDGAGALAEMSASLKNVLTPAQYEQWQRVQSGAASTDPRGRTINEVKKTE